MISAANQPLAWSRRHRSSVRTLAAACLLMKAASAVVVAFQGPTDELPCMMTLEYGSQAERKSKLLALTKTACT